MFVKHKQFILKKILISNNGSKSKAQRVLNYSNQTIDLMNNQEGRKRGGDQGGHGPQDFVEIEKNRNRNRQPIRSGPQIFGASATSELTRLT